MSILKFLILIITLTPYHSSFAQNITLSFSLMDSEIIYNNSVGNDWSTAVFIIYDNEEVQLNRFKPQRKIIMDINSNITIKAMAIEDDKYPDIGSNKIVYSVQEIVDDLPKTVSISAVVKEGHGRYSGNTAKWKFIIRIE